MIIKQYSGIKLGQPSHVTTLLLDFLVCKVHIVLPTLIECWEDSLR